MTAIDGAELDKSEADAVIAELCKIAEPLTPDGEIFRAIYWAVDVLQRLSAEKAAREEAERERDRLRADVRAYDRTMTIIAQGGDAPLAELLRSTAATLTTAETEAASLRERVKALEARLEESIYGEMMAAYHVGVERDGKWMDCARSEGEWLRGELGITEPGWHDAETIKAMIPEAARRSARATLEEKNDG